MTATFYVGDAVTVMNTLPEKSVDLVLTSPPFLALRSYLPSDHPDKALEGGSQATPGAYIDWLLDVVEACARVLAPHGSLCFELGDTYSGSGGAGGDYNEDGLREGQPAYKGSDARKKHRVTLADGRTIQSAGISNGLPRKGDAWPLAKSLSLIPETFRWAMVYGHNPHTGRTTPPWRLRNVIRWVRPNPPVGALGDKFRPATSELMVFCKAKDRFFDLDAVRGPFAREYQPETEEHPKRRAKTDGGWSTLPDWDPATSAGAPPLDWWNIPPGGYPGAHYAVWPPELLVKPIKAMCPEKVCRRCGEARRRISAELNEERGRIAALISSQRSLLGLDRKDLLPLFIGHYKNSDSVLAQISNWELAKNVPVPRDWDLLKRHLDISTSRFDELIEAEYRWNDAEYTNESGRGFEGDRAMGRGGHQGIPRAERHAPDRFSDCGCVCDVCGGRGTITTRTVSEREYLEGLGETQCFGCSGSGEHGWRPGLVLDPFAGSGTTLAVATGHGRDAIGIDLDERNYELSLDRVGPLILQRGEIRDGTAPPT